MNLNPFIRAPPGAWKPEAGVTYFIVSDYAKQPYEFVWRGSKQNRDHLTHKTLYRTRKDALRVIRSRDRKTV